MSQSRNKKGASYRNFDTYISDDHYKYTKESFKNLSKMLLSQFKQDDHSLKFLDVGCATGALIKHLSDNFSGQFCGVDISDELLNIARERLPMHKWICGSAISLPSDFNLRFDLVTCFGTIGIFDEIEAKKLVFELIRSTKRGGLIVLFSQFNTHDLDVLITHRKKRKEWEKGWNIYSEETIKDWVKDKSKSVSFIDFEMPIELEKRDDLIRTWTFKDAGGRNQLTNGLNLLVNLKYAIIKV